MPCRSASFTRYSGVTAAASRQARSFDSRDRAPLRPSHVPNSSIIRSTCPTVSGGPIRYSGCASACARPRSRRNAASSYTRVATLRRDDLSVRFQTRIWRGASFVKMRYLQREKRVGRWAIVSAVERVVSPIGRTSCRAPCMTGTPARLCNDSLRLARRSVVPAIRRVNRVDAQVAAAHYTRNSRFDGRLPSVRAFRHRPTLRSPHRCRPTETSIWAVPRSRFSLSYGRLSTSRP